MLGGNVGWTEEARRSALTEPTQYFQNGIINNGAGMSRLADLDGKPVATITGFSFIPNSRKFGHQTGVL